MGQMDLEIGLLEQHWDKYLAWCRSNGLFPDFGDYLIWLDDYDINIGQEQAEYESV